VRGARVTPLEHHFAMADHQQAIDVAVLAGRDLGIQRGERRGIHALRGRSGFRPIGNCGTR